MTCPYSELRPQSTKSPLERPARVSLNYRRTKHRVVVFILMLIQISGGVGCGASSSAGRTRTTIPSTNQDVATNDAKTDSIECLSFGACDEPEGDPSCTDCSTSGLPQIARISEVTVLSTDVAIVIEDTDDNVMSILGEKDSGGSLLVPTGVSYTSRNGDSITAMIGPDGLPARVVNNGRVYEMRDYTASSVRVSTIYNGVQHEALVPFDSSLKSISTSRVLGFKGAGAKTSYSAALWERGFATARSSFPGFRDNVLRPTLGIMGHVLGIASCLATAFPEPTTTILTAVGCGSYLAQQSSELLSGEDNELAQATSVTTNLSQCALLRDCAGSIVDAANSALDVSELLDQTPVDPPDMPEPTCENPEEEYSAAFDFCVPICPSGFAVTSYLYDCRNEDNCEPMFPYPHPSGQGCTSIEPDRDYCLLFNLYWDGECQTWCKSLDPDCTNCPANSTVNDLGTCVCDAGFMLDNAGSQCEPDIDCAANASPDASGRCYCDDGYVANATNTGCVGDANCPSGSTPTGPSQCTCEPGYIVSGNQCVLANRDCSLCEPGWCQPINYSQDCCPTDAPYVWGDGRCHPSPPGEDSTDCPSPGDVACTCTDDHLCVGYWCNGVMYHADGLYCGSFSCTE